MSENKKAQAGLKKRPVLPLQNAVLCFLASLIWGTAFVAQKVGGDVMGPLTFIGFRYILGFVALLPLVLVRRKIRKRRLDAGDRTLPAYDRKTTLLGGLLCGLILTMASMMQQIPIAHVEVGKAGFLTALYIVIVPILSFVMTRRSHIRIWIAAGISLVGLYFLCNLSEMKMGIWDMILLGCAIMFSCHILVIDHFAPRTDGVELSCLQFLVAGILGTILCFVFETPVSSIAGAGLQGWISLLYAGIFSSGIAYTLQIVGQKGADPAACSLLLSLESVISAIAGYFLLGQVLSVKELAGCALMFFAIILVQLPERSGEG